MVEDDIFSGRRVLLVEDDVPLAEHIETLLVTLGYDDVFLATSLGDAEEIAACEDIDLALLDVNLADGMQTVSLGHSLASEGIRVVFMSGFNPEDMARATRGYEFMEKPISLSRLKATLQRAILRAPVVQSVEQRRVAS